MARRGKGRGASPARMLSLAGELARTGIKSGEVGLASAQTIGHRTAMMAAAFGDPVAMANPEFIRMGTEKVEAAAEAGHAMASGMNELGRAWLALLSGQGLTAGFAFGLGGFGNPAALAELQRRTMTEAMTAGLNAGLRVAEAYSAIASAGLAPVHRTVSANARRLARERR